MKKWYISCNFNPLQVEKIARLCTVLEQNQQMLLCGKKSLFKRRYDKGTLSENRYGIRAIQNGKGSNFTCTFFRHTTGNLRDCRM